jgi:hypothetical protein
MIKLRGSVRIYGQGCSYRATWPLGTLTITTDRLEFRVIGRKFELHHSHIEKIHYYALPRPYIRVFHSNENVPKLVQFGTLHGKKLCASLKRFDFPLTRSYLVEPSSDIREGLGL